MANCLNHQWAEATGTCARCSQPYCDACLVDFLGQRYCGVCRDYRVHEMQGGGAQVINAPFHGTGTVDMGRWLNAGWAIVSPDVLTWVVAMLLVNVISFFSCGICSGPMMVGMYMMAFRKMTYGTVEIGNVFDGFRRFLNAFVLLLLIAGISIFVRFLAEIPSYIVMFAAPDRPELAILTSVLQISVAVISSAVLGGATLFALPHVAARNANPIEALTASWLVFKRNPLMFWLTSFVFWLVSLLGILALCVGVLVTFPLVFAATAHAYADHFGIEGWDRA